MSPVEQFFSAIGIGLYAGSVVALWVVQRQARLPWWRCAFVAVGWPVVLPCWLVVDRLEAGND